MLKICGAKIPSVKKGFKRENVLSLSGILNLKFLNGASF